MYKISKVNLFFLVRKQNFFDKYEKFEKKNDSFDGFNSI